MISNTVASSTAPPDLTEVHRLEALVQARLHGRVRQFRLSLGDRGLVLFGHARTYHAKQLAQHLVMEASALPLHANQIEVF